MSTEAASSRLQPGDGSNESTERGCTSWLLISIFVLTLTTAFVFGWGLGAPNMYNQYTEPFLKGNDPCAAERLARANISQTTAAPFVLDNQRVDTGDAETGTDANGEAVAKARPQEEPFNFFVETVKGIPQTVFLIGAFIGAVTGPFWVNLFDRKRTVFANYIFCFASSLCVLLASYLNQPWLFYLSRLLLGYQGR
jgi:MFS family permease